MKKAKAMVSLSCSVIAMPLSFFVLFCYKKGDGNGAIIFFYCINAIVFFYPSFVARKVTATMPSSLCLFFSCRHSFFLSIVIGSIGAPFKGRTSHS
jgi:uncharacterized membrane protein